MEYYETAEEFLRLGWAIHYCIGLDLGLLNEDDATMLANELEEAVFVGAIKNGMFDNLKDQVIDYLIKDHYG